MQSVPTRPSLPRRRRRKEAAEGGGGRYPDGGASREDGRRDRAGASPCSTPPKPSGFGIVIPHDTIATAVAELTTAQAAARQSRAALERAQRLIGTPGAMSADAVESAARQAETDSAALALAEQRLTTIIGAGPPGGVAKNGLGAAASWRAARSSCCARRFPWARSRARRRPLCVRRISMPCRPALRIPLRAGA